MTSYNNNNCNLEKYEGAALEEDCKCPLASSTWISREEEDGCWILLST